MRRRGERGRRARDLTELRHARADRARRRPAADDAADHVGRRASPRARRGTCAGPGRPRSCTRAPACPCTHVAADQAHVVRAPRAADAGGRALVGRPQGLPDRGADRHAGHRAVVGIGHRPARSREAHLEPGGDRADRRLGRAAPADPADDRDACRWRRRPPPARPARRHAGRDGRRRRAARQPRHGRAGAAASRACRSAPAAPSASPSTRRASTRPGRSSATR